MQNSIKKISLITCTLFINTTSFAMSKKIITPSIKVLKTINTRSLFNALHMHDTTQVSDLLKNNLVDSTVKYEGFTPLHIAAWLRQPESIHMLKKYGAKINAPNDDRRTPLFYAAHLYHYTDNHTDDAKKTIELLLESNLNAQDNNKLTPLIVASGTGHCIAAHLLLKHGASLHAQDVEGNTALHHAAHAGHDEIVEALLLAGAPLIKNNQGKTPRDLTHDSVIKNLLNQDHSSLAHIMKKIIN